MLFLAGLYAASPQLIRWWASLLAERLGVTLVTLEAGRPGLHGMRLPHLEAAAGQAHVVVDDALAFVGGAILNLMPCVFPILSLKVLSFARSSDHDRHLHSWLYTAGVISAYRRG